MHFQNFSKVLTRSGRGCIIYVWDNKGRISHLLLIDIITSGHVILADNLFELKRETFELILTVKRTEWRKFIDYFGLRIEANLSRVVTKNKYSVKIGYIPSP